MVLFINSDKRTESDPAISNPSDGKAQNEKGETMHRYYYKGSEKIGPVSWDEIDNLAWWGDIKPDTILELEGSDGQADTSGAHGAYQSGLIHFGTNPLRISLKAARRLHSVLFFIWLSSLFCMFFCWALILVFWNHRDLLKIYFVIDIVLMCLTALAPLLDTLFCTKKIPKQGEYWLAKGGKVPPEYKRGE